MTARIHWRENRIVQDRIKRSIAYTIVIIMAVAYIFPLYWLVVTALKTDVEIFPAAAAHLPAQIRSGITFGESTTYIPFWRYMWNTIVISGLTVLGTVLSCTFIAYGFARIRWPGRNIIFLIYLSTIMLPSQVTLIPLYLIFRDLGWVGTFLPLVVPHFLRQRAIRFPAAAILADHPAWN